MGIKLPPVWRKRRKCTAEGDIKPQPPPRVVFILRFLIEVSKQLIFTFAGWQIVLSFDLGISLFENLRLTAMYENGALPPDGANCPPGVHSLMPGYELCAYPTYANHPDGFWAWLSDPPNGIQMMILLGLMSSFFLAGIAFTALLIFCGGKGCKEPFPAIGGASMAASPDVAICCACAPRMAPRVVPT